MINSHNAIFSVYIPLLMTVILSGMTYFHWQYKLKYLYLSGIFFLLVYAILSMILLSYTVDEKSFSTTVNNLSPMQFPVSILSITLFFVSVGFFVAQENSFSLFFSFEHWHIAFYAVRILFVFLYYGWSCIAKKWISICLSYLYNGAKYGLCKQ